MYSINRSLQLSNNLWNHLFQRFGEEDRNWDNFKYYFQLYTLFYNAHIPFLVCIYSQVVPLYSLPQRTTIHIAVCNHHILML